MMFNVQGEFTVPDSAKSWQFSARANRPRRSLVPLGGLLGVVLIATALLGLFGVYYTDKGHHAQMEALQRLTDGLDTVRQAQIHFKKQVQEWKNVLLRGNDPEQRDRYRRAFESEADKTTKLLNNLISGNFGFELPAGAVEKLIADHHLLSRIYRDSLDEFGTGSAFDSQKIDAKVRGIDRPLDTELDALADMIDVQEAARYVDMRRVADARYEAQQNLSTAGLAVCVLLMGAFLILAIRNEQPR